MQVRISSHRTQITDSVKKYIIDHITRDTNKYFHNALSSHVMVRKEKISYHVSILVNDGISKDVLLKADSESNDIHSAFDQALSKLVQQLRKHKTKIKNHKHTKPIIPEREALDKKKPENINSPLSPLIIAEKADNLDQISVGEAVRRMEQQNLAITFFINTTTGQLNAVYKRHDGHISWLNPKTKQNREKELYMH